MKSKIIRTYQVSPLLVVIPITLAIGTARHLAEPRVRALEALKGVSPFEPNSQIEGPQVLRGKIRGPADRKTRLGEPVAAHWWAVVRRDEDETKVHCQDRERGQLVLETASGAFPIKFSDANPSLVALFADDRDDDEGLPISFDLGSTPRTTRDAIPPDTCQGDGAKYEQFTLEQGADVEVMGCVGNGAIDSCTGPVNAVLSLPTLEVHRRRRLESLLNLFRIVAGVTLVSLVSAGILALVQKWRTLRVLRPGKEA